MINYIHVDCGKVAFTAFKRILQNETITTENVLINGVRPAMNDEMICQSCGKHFFPSFLSVIHEDDVKGKCT